MRFSLLSLALLVGAQAAAAPPPKKTTAPKLVVVVVIDQFRASDLERLSRLVELHLPERLILLGDLIHARSGRASITMKAVGEWRGVHRQLAITLVRGNHDLRAGDPPAEWNIHCTSEPLVEAPFVLQHEPAVDDRGTDLPGNQGPEGRGLHLVKYGGLLFLHGHVSP